MAERERFDPTKHLLNLKGKSYLPVAARIAAFRDECPIAAGWGIATRLVDGSREAKFATFQATITDPEGRVVATATKTEDVAGFGDYLEKAETGSIGRALGIAGFGTLFALEFEEGERLADAPISPPVPASRPPAAPIASPPAAAPSRAESPRGEALPAIGCEECGVVLTAGQNTVSTRMYGKSLCPAHQRAAGELMGKIASRPAV